MKQFLMTVTVIFILCYHNTDAQITAYNFSQAVKLYGSTGTGTLVGNTLQDDDVNTAALPFPFYFDGVLQTTVNVSSNGFLSFDPVLTTNYDPVGDVASFNVISPFGGDLTMGTTIHAKLTAGSNTLTNVSYVGSINVGDSLFDFASDFAMPFPKVTAIVGNNIILNTTALNSQINYDVVFMNGSIRQSLMGTAPGRICEFEYRNFSRFSIYNESVTFKIRLYETSNKIEFLYGTSNPGFNNTMALEVGLKGGSNADYNSRKINSSNTWTTSAAATQPIDLCYFYPGKAPVPGTCFEWSPLSCTTPSLSVVKSNPVFCSGKTVTLTATGAGSYNWSNGVVGPQLVVNPINDFTYTLVGSNNSCTIALAVPVIVVQNPKLVLTQTRPLICAGQSATITVSGATGYTWSTGASASFIVASPTVTTTYTVSGEQSGCTSFTTTSVNVSKCTDTGEESLRAESVQVYPNPFKSAITLKNTCISAIRVKIVDAIGNLVYASVLKAETSEVFDTAALNAGFYIVSLQSGTETVTKKIIKH